MIGASGWSVRMMAMMCSSCSGLTSSTLLSRMVLQNSICSISRLSISSSLFCFISFSPPSNSSTIRRASTTVTTLSR
ncbi:hypothetical protein EVA_05579 [gut metagenome]|uniref:Uncharacterized protein n=1 Tax=gut metagenome TaxID=749906 RepID=J9GU54_9ZZZZ